MDKEIKVRCHTNIDEYSQAIWPDTFSCRPVIGDYVQAEATVYGGMRRLRIVAITHTMNGELDVELHKERL